MAHFAEIINNKVGNVIAVHDNELLVDGVEVEAKGKEFCEKTFGGEWVQTSYTDRIRKKMATRGDDYNRENDIFVSPQPYPSWTIDENFDWQPPVPKPEGLNYWNETKQQWTIQSHFNQVADITISNYFYDKRM